jgi:NitT/TauT family transport system substrate-binding protein
MMKTLRTLVAAAGVMALAGPALAMEKITYLFPAPDFLPSFAPQQLAKHKGYFADEGLEVEFQVGKGGADVAKQVGVGNAEVGGGIGDTPLIVRANGIDVKAVALLGTKSLTQINIRKDAGIESLADLKGKAVGAMSYQDTTYYNLLAALGSAGLTRDDVDIQAVGPGGIIQLMISGDIVAMSGVPEWAAAIRGAGVELETITIDSIFPAMAQAILASDETIEERPEVVQGVVNAIIRAMTDIIEDPAQAAQDYVSFVPQHEGKEAQIEAIMRSYIDLVYGDDPSQLGMFDAERMKEVQDFYLAKEIVREAVPIEEAFTNQFVQQATN